MSGNFKGKIGWGDTSVAFSESPRHFHAWRIFSWVYQRDFDLMLMYLIFSSGIGASIFGFSVSANLFCGSIVPRCMWVHVGACAAIQVCSHAPFGGQMGMFRGGCGVSHQQSYWQM